jgi:hypothetical protein
MRLGEPQSWSWHFEEEKNLFPLQENQDCLIQTSSTQPSGVRKLFAKVKYFENPHIVRFH